MGELSLQGLDGGNPLAFLAALGTLRTLTRAWRDREVRMAWRPSAGWTPVLRTEAELTPDEVLDALERAFRVESPRAETGRVKDCDRAVRTARKALKDATDRAKKEAQTQGIRGRRATEQAAEATRELRAELERLEAAHRAALDDTVPLPQLGLGNDLSVPRDVFREHARNAARAATPGDRDWADFVAACGSDAWPQDERRIRSTPFCFINGAGHQYFLKTYSDLLGATTRAHLTSTLFELWTYQDERLSFRWDPAEDRRYALRANNPSDDPALTMWGANRLGVEAIPLFPSAPDDDRDLSTAGWRQQRGGAEWTWPIWSPFLLLHEVGTLLGDAALTCNRVNRTDLRARGVVEVMRATRLLNDKRYNFTPATPAP